MMYSMLLGWTNIHVNNDLRFPRVSCDIPVKIMTMNKTQWYHELSGKTVFVWKCLVVAWFRWRCWHRDPSSLGLQSSCYMLKANTLRHTQNGSHLADNINNLIFFSENLILFQVSLKCLPKILIKQYASIASDILVPNRWQAIMWTNAGLLVYWCIQGLLSLDV